MDSKENLMADLVAARAELLAVVDLVPPEERSSRLICGEWTLKDTLGHVTDWEWVWVESLRQVAAGRSPQFGQFEGIEARNQAFFQARRDQSWEKVRSDLHAAHEVMLEALQGIDEEDLGRSMVYITGARGPVYRWVRIFVEHDLEHARELKDALV